MVDLQDVQRAAELKFGEIVGSVITGERESMFAIQRPSYGGQAGYDFMTIRHHENGRFYWGTYDITRGRAMAYLSAFAERAFLGNDATVNRETGEIERTAANPGRIVTRHAKTTQEAAKEAAKLFLKPVRHKVAFDDVVYDCGAQVNSALSLNWLSRTEARRILRSIGFDMKEAAKLVRIYGHAGRDKGQEATGEAAEITRLEVIT